MKLARRFVTIPLALGMVAGGCGGGRSEGDTSVAAGDPAGIEVEALNYEVTPERYQRWLAAQRALDAIAGLPEPPGLEASRVTDADVDRAVRYLESDPRARAALARAGVSARDYVLTTLALDQALVASASTGVRGSAASPGTGAAGGSGARAPDRPSGGAARPSRTRTVYRNVPRRTSEVVERNRDEITRVRTGMRFRIVKERTDTTHAAGTPRTATTTLVVPAGTALALRADGRVCGTTHKAGARVTATVTSPVSVVRGVAIPAGATAGLSVVAPPRAGASPEFALNSISFDGRTYNVSGAAVASRVERVPLGSTSQDAQKIAGGAAVGAVAGRVLGRDTKSTVIGAAVGAAAGAAAADASRRYDVCVPAGAPIQATLRESLDLRV
jgi:hypothetical protein